MKKMSVGKCFSAITCILAVVTFILLGVYASKGGIVQTMVYASLAIALVCEAICLFGEKVWTDFACIIACVALAFVVMTVFSDGIWNIAESISGIKMVGLPELAGMNYQLAGIGLVSVITAIVAGFTKK